MPEEYEHGTVTHSFHFIDPETDAYTNSTEPSWQKFEEGRKLRDGTERALLNLYVDEFVWKKRMGAMRCTTAGPK